LQLLFATNVPFVVCTSVAKQKLNLFQVASTSVAQAGASAAKVVWCQIVYAGVARY
jgi:hypothetical protein